jgi:hypothetical protein
MFSTVKCHSQRTSQIEGPREENTGKINSGRENASLSWCNNNEDYCFLNVMPLVSGNSPTFRRNVQTQSAIHKKLPIPEDFVAVTAMRTPQRRLTN